MKSSSSLIKAKKNSDVVSTWRPQVFSSEEEASQRYEEFLPSNFAQVSSKEASEPRIHLSEDEIKGQSLVTHGKAFIPRKQAGSLAQPWQPMDFSRLSHKEEEIHDVSILGQQERNTLFHEISTRLSEAELRAKTILDESETRAAQILRQAEMERVRTLEEAYAAGFEAGRKEVKQVLESAVVILNETQVFREKMLRESEASIIEMVQAIAKKLFGGGFVLEPPLLEQMVARAISEASRLGKLRVYLNPEDEKNLVSLWQDSELTVNGQKIQLVPSQNITRGGCFIEGEFGSVDSRIDIQLDMIQESITRTLTDQMELDL